MVDLNSRIGIPTEFTCGDEELKYVGCKDITVNSNGKSVLQLCKDNNLVVINNLQHGEKHFESKLSFRKKSRWISEPDLLLSSNTCLDMVKSFDMIQQFENKYLYSDHALLEFVLDLEKTKEPSKLLLNSACNHG